jgi:hypothetical protein
MVPADRAVPGVNINNPNSVVSAISDGSGNRYLFWRTSAERLMEAKYNGHSWSTSLVPGVKDVLSRPTASFSRTLDRIYVFWMGLPPHMDLMEAYYTNRWHGPIDLGMGPLGGPPSAPPTWFSDNDGIGATAVVWENQHRQLGYATAFDPANKKSWHGPFTDRAIKSMTSPPAVVDAGGGEPVFFYIAANGHLRMGNLLAGSLTFGPCDLGFGSLGSVPDVVWGPIPATIGDVANANVGHAPHFTGNCPKSLGAPWYGQPGAYTMCWAGIKTGLSCAQWFDVNGTIFFALPFTVKPGAGTLGSAPSMAVWPVINTNPSYESAIFAYWQNSKSSDLMQMRIDNGAKPPMNLHIQV